MRLRLEIKIKWHSKCNRLYLCACMWMVCILLVWPYGCTHMHTHAHTCTHIRVYDMGSTSVTVSATSKLYVSRQFALLKNREHCSHFSEVSPTLIVYSKYGIKLTFENVYLSRPAALMGVPFPPQYLLYLSLVAEFKFSVRKSRALSRRASQWVSVDQHICLVKSSGSGFRFSVWESTALSRQSRTAQMGAPCLP